MKNHDLHIQESEGHCERGKADRYSVRSHKTLALPCGGSLAALSRIAFALIAMAFCPKKIAILSLAENGTNQFASANRPGRVFGTAKLEQIRKGAKGGGFGGATPNSISRHQTTVIGNFESPNFRKVKSPL